jgi:uncharacterized protein YprB with RNaseH-like and TPR domain
VADGADHVLGGRWDGGEDARFLVVDRTYHADHLHGRARVADAVPPGGWRRLALLASRASGPDGALFVDLETTGLAGGAGTYAFLVGCGWFADDGFQVRQFFLSSFLAERALLEAVDALAARAGTVVTFNGKTFDVPLLESRYVMHRKPTPFEAKPHVDLLHTARRLWRGPDEGCRLGALERLLLGVERTGDVPGMEIPARYFDYVHCGDPRGLVPVLEHNRLDLLSLAMLTGHAMRLLDAGVEAASTAREALGIGRLYERAGMTDEALECFARAGHRGGAVATEALRAEAVFCRRLRRYEQAARAWQRLLEQPGCEAHVVREATEALAVYHEHRRRDPGAARSFAVRSLQADASPARRLAAEYRLARLDRKLGLAAAGGTSLFRMAWVTPARPPAPAD